MGTRAQKCLWLVVSCRVVLCLPPQIHVDPHPIFKRDGNDIHVTHELRFVEALLGSTATVPTIDGAAELTVPQGAQPAPA